MRQLIAVVAWHRASLRPPWRREAMTLHEHFGLTALYTLTFTFPYLW